MIYQGRRRRPIFKNISNQPASVIPQESLGKSVEGLGPSLCHPLSRQSQVSAVTFDLLTYTFPNGVPFTGFFQGSWVEAGFQSGMGQPHKEMTVQNLLGDYLNGPRWVGIEMKALQLQHE